jgi:signal transduction histidine kinase
MVSDDGIGFNVREALTHRALGLRSMRERVWLVHGNMELVSQPGGGATLIVTIGSNESHDASAPVRTIAE